jgi:stearoyl-CoA desaturase (delta-9 desaturase)
MWFGLVELPWWGYVLVTLALTHITIISVTVYLHRHQAHRALDLHPAVAHFFRFWLWLTTAMVTAEWVAVHRKHHARCETEEDPHSPQIAGLKAILLRGAEYYKAAAAEPETLAKFAHGTPDDWIERNLYRRHCNWGPTLMAVIDLALFGVAGITIWAVQMLWIPFWAAGVVNGVGHYFGYRNFEPQDASTNIVPVGVLIGGEELHNNHHAFPSSARFSIRRWEFDLGWSYIRLLQACRLARVKRVAPSAKLVEKHDVDMETVSAIVRARVYVMAFYAREVLVPTLREELAGADRHCRQLLRRARRAMIRDASLVDDRARERIDRALAHSGRLAVVYAYKQQLQSLWNRSHTSHEQLLNGLRQWCAEAEETGIQVLQDFARRLRGFTVVPAPLPA